MTQATSRKKLEPGQCFLVAYSGLLTAIVAAALLSGVTPISRKMQLNELNVQRINLVEPDGTLRMVVSNHARFPGAILRGVEYPHPVPREDAGMLFYNDEGTENGGLIFSGRRDSTGKIVNAGGSLTFDKYEQDQVVQLVGAEDSANRLAGLLVNDRPDHSILPYFQELDQLKAMPAAERDKLMAARRASHAYGVQRIAVARADDGVAKISLNDASGRPRIVMGVAPDGAASLRFLDASGKVTNELTPTPQHSQ